MTPKNDLVRLRLTTMEREAWAQAAGGKRKLSEWIRAVCNQAALPGGLSGPGGVIAVPREEPVAVRPRARAGDAAKPRRDAETGSEQQALPSVQSSKDCSRWMHHRKGTYCGSCRKVA